MSDFEQEEQDLLQAKKQYDGIPLPDCIDDHIRLGMQKAIQSRKKRKTARRTTVASCFVLASLLASIRFSPAVAAYVSDIPGLHSLVELIRHDKGLQMAANHNFAQRIDRFDRHNGIAFTVDQIMVDQGRMNIFYSIEHPEGLENLGLTQVELLDDTGESLKVAYAYGTPDVVTTNKKQGRIEVNLSEQTAIPDYLTLRVKMDDWLAEDASDQRQLEPTWQVRFPIDKAKYQGLKQHIPINKTVSVDGQQILFEKMTVYPTKIALDIKYDPNNTQQIFGFDDLRLVDEKGGTWATISDGFSSSSKSDDHVVVYLESNYFAEPKKLFLKASGIRALEKTKLDVVVDLNRRSLIKSPSPRLQLKEVRTQGDAVGLDFELEKDVVLDNRKSYSYFHHEALDSAGNRYEFREGSSSVNASAVESIALTMVPTETKKGVADTLSLRISDYPTRLHGSIDLQIK